MPNINAVTNTFDIETTGTLYIDAIGSASDAGITLALGTDAGDDFNVGSGKFVVEGDTSYVGIGRATPAGKLEVYAGQMVATNGAFALSKFNSQGVAWSSVPTLSSLVFNGGSSDRPEISWIRGGDNYPEFAIRQHTTADQGCQIYCGTGSSAPIESMAITIGGVAIGTSSPASAKLVVKGDGNPIQAWLNSSGTEVGRWDASGRLGINETDPSKKFTVVDTSAGSLLSAIRVQNADNTNGTATGIGFSVHASPGSLAYDKAGIFFERAASFGRGHLHLCNDIAADGNDVALSDAKITLDYNGNVGVGVTSPSTRLDIGAGAMEFDEMTAPAAGAVNTARLFVQDNGSGKTQLCVRFNTGAIQILATEP